jgi:ATP-binding cassette subfamily B protein
VQRFSSDWHANSFAGSTVRKITRGMWALDVINDVLLPTVVALAGTVLLPMLHWPVTGPVMAAARWPTARTPSCWRPASSRRRRG